MTHYHHTKFGSILIKESKVTEGGGGAESPQVENVLNRPGEIGLSYMRLYTVQQFIIFIKNVSS